MYERQVSALESPVMRRSITSIKRGSKTNKNLATGSTPVARLAVGSGSKTSQQNRCASQACPPVDTSRNDVKINFIYSQPLSSPPAGSGERGAALLGISACASTVAMQLQANCNTFAMRGRVYYLCLWVISRSRRLCLFATFAFTLEMR